MRTADFQDITYLPLLAFLWLSPISIITTRYLRWGPMIIVSLSVITYFVFRTSVVVDIAKKVWPVILLYSVFILSTAWSTYPTETYKSSIFTFGFIPLLFSVGITLETSRNRFEKLRTCITGTVIVAITVSAYFMSQLGTLRPLTDTRIAEGARSFANSGAGMVLILLPYLFTYWKFGNKIFYGGVILLSYLIIFFSLSRTLIVIGSSLLLFYFYYNSRLKLKGKIIRGTAAFFMFAIVAGVIMSVPAFENILSRFGSRLSRTDIMSLFQRPELSKSGFSRYAQYYYSAELFADNLITGTGYDTLRSYLSKKYNYTGATSHNFILKTAYSTGLLGLTILGYLIYRVYGNMIECLRYKNHSPGRYSGLVFASIVSISVAFLQGQTRGLFGIPVFYLPLAVGLWVKK